MWFKFLLKPPCTIVIDNLSLAIWDTSLWSVFVKFEHRTPGLILAIFRWFKITLKPPYTVAHGNLLSTIWDTSHWTSFVKFGLKTA